MYEDEASTRAGTSVAASSDVGTMSDVESLSASLESTYVVDDEDPDTGGLSAKDSKVERQCELAVRQNKVRSDSALGQSYRRKVPKAERDVAGTKGMQLRMEWVKGVWAGLQVLRTETLKYTDSEVKKGEYLSFDTIVEREGGYHNMNNIRAAERYCRHCQLRKGIWARYNPMTGRVQYLYVRDGIEQKKDKGWEISKTETQTSTAEVAIEKKRPPEELPGKQPNKKQQNHRRQRYRCTSSCSWRSACTWKPCTGERERRSAQDQKPIRQKPVSYGKLEEAVQGY